MSLQLGTGMPGIDRLLPAGPKLIPGLSGEAIMGSGKLSAPMAETGTREIGTGMGGFMGSLGDVLKIAAPALTGAAFPGSSLLTSLAPRLINSQLSPQPQRPMPQNNQALALRNMMIQQANKRSMLLNLLRQRFSQRPTMRPL